MAEITHVGRTPMDMCIYLEHSMKIKQHWLHDNLCSRDNVEKFRNFDEDLKATT